MGLCYLSSVHQYNFLPIMEWGPQLWQLYQLSLPSTPAESALWKVGAVWLDRAEQRMSNKTWTGRGQEGINIVSHENKAWSWKIYFCEAQSMGDALLRWFKVTMCSSDMSLCKASSEKSKGNNHAVPHSVLSSLLFHQCHEDVRRGIEPHSLNW